MSYGKIEASSLHCPNCGVVLTGIRGEDGAMLIECQRCKCVVYSKIHNSNEFMIKIRRPKRHDN